MLPIWLYTMNFRGWTWLHGLFAQSNSFVLIGWILASLQQSSLVVFPPYFLIASSALFLCLTKWVVPSYRPLQCDNCTFMWSAKILTRNISRIRSIGTHLIPHSSGIQLMWYRKSTNMARPHRKMKTISSPWNWGVIGVKVHIQTYLASDRILALVKPHFLLLCSKIVVLFSCQVKRVLANGNSLCNIFSDV